jgi:predicted YcjX-like family ATPase
LVGEFNLRTDKNALLRRIISPAIDKVALVASKVDHVGPDGQQALNQLLAEMLRRSRQHFQFERIEHELFAVAGIATSKAGRLSDGTVVLDGYLKGNQKVRIGAPAVPTQLPNADQWQQGFEFPQFVPHFSAADSPLPHIRLDQLLEFLLGDKLK